MRKPFGDTFTVVGPKAPEQRKVRVEHSTNYTKYLLLDSAGCVSAEVDVKNWGDEFSPTESQILESFRLLIPGAVLNVVRDRDHA